MTSTQRTLLPSGHGYHESDQAGRHQFMVSVAGAGTNEDINNSSALATHPIGTTLSPPSKPTSNKSKRDAFNQDVGTYNETTSPTA